MKMKNVINKPILDKNFKRVSKQLPVNYITTAQFKILLGRKDIDYDKLREGQTVAVFRGYQLRIRNRQVYFRYYNKQYGITHKIGKEMLISNFPLPRGKIIKRI